MAVIIVGVALGANFWGYCFTRAYKCCIILLRFGGSISTIDEFVIIPDHLH